LGLSVKLFRAVYPQDGRRRWACINGPPARLGINRSDYYKGERPREPGAKDGRG